MEARKRRIVALRLVWFAFWVLVVFVWAVFISLLFWRNESKIQVPISDSRVYKEIVLENGIRVLLVQDVKADQAAAAISVKAGSNQEWLPGLAHLTEHMLFYSSADFPEEDGLRAFLASHGGDINAYTDSEETNYYFYVNKDSLQESLEILAGAFTNPIFTEEAVDREILAVNSEHQRNVYDDEWRFYRLFEMMAGQEHPFSRFSTGSVETLKSSNLAGEVQKFFNRFYKSENLKLVVQGKESVTQLGEWVANAFARVPTGPGYKFEYVQPFPVKNKLIVAPKISPGHDLRIVWPLASELNYVNEQPGDFIRYLLSNPGPGGLKGQMPEWIVGVESEIKWTYSDFSGLALKTTLTSAGLNNWNTIAARIYGYLDTIVRAPEPELLLLWTDYSQISSINFYYSEPQSPEDEASMLASNMQRFSSDSYRSGFSLKRKFDYGLIMNTLARMQSDGGLYFLMGNKLPDGGVLGDTPVRLNQYESNYDMLYQIVKADIATESADFALPTKNPFVPNNFKIVSCHECSELPELVTDMPTVKTWHQYAGHFETPKVHVFTKIAVADAADNVILHEMIAAHVTLLASEQLYLWTLAGYSLNLVAKQTGLELELSGWSDDFTRFFEVALASLTTASSLFHVLKDLQAQIYNSIDTQQPYEVSFELLHRLLVKDYVSQWERTRQLASLHESEFSMALSSFMDNASLEILAVGNLSPSTADEFSKIAAKLYVLEGGATTGVQVAKVLKPQVFATKGGLNNNAIINYYQFEAYDPDSWASVLVLSKILSEAGFTALRTQQQLGYIVYADAVRDWGDQGVYILVQGSYKDPSEMNEAIKDFLGSLEIDPGGFQDFKASVEASLYIPDLSIDAMTTRLWTEIAASRYEFDNKRLALEVAALKLGDVESLLAQAASSKGLLSVQVYKGDEENPASIDLDYFRVRNEYFPSFNS